MELHRAGAALLVAMAGVPAAQLRLWSIGPIGAWACLGLTATGMGFAWWVRLHLGRFWSVAVVRKADHRVVDSGPYALARHPIYTGIGLALLASAIALGRLYGLAGVGLLLAGFWQKARLEERFLRAEIGAEAFEPYAARVPMLLPRLG